MTTTRGSQATSGTATASGELLAPGSFPYLIAPLTRDVFLAEYWEREPLHIARAQRDYFESLLTFDEIDRVLSSDSVSYPKIRLVRAGEPIEMNQYTTRDGRTDVASVWQLFADGATVILDQLDRRVYSLAALCRGLEAEFSAPFQTNIYLTPPKGTGFKPHYDTHDVFILQVGGSKTWKFFGTPVTLPLRGQEYDSAHYGPGDQTSEVELRCGDLLYVPRGLVHAATSCDEASLHITLGAHCYTWSDVLLEAMAAVCIRDAAFRKGLPLGFAEPRFDRAELRNAFRVLAEKFAATTTCDDALDGIIDDFVLTRSPHLREQMRQVTEAERLNGQSVIGPRPNLIYRIQSDGPEIHLTCYGRDIRVPIHAHEELVAALRSPRIRIEHLPGELDLDGKIALARRLIREGLVLIHEN